MEKCIISGMVTFLRLVHGAVTAIFLFCLGYIYYSGITGRVTTLTWITGGVILLEGLAVLANRGNCPMNPLQRRFGDDSTFFELLLPKPLAKKAFSFFAVVTAIGFGLLIW